MARHHRRPKRDRLAVREVRESEQRVRADIKALHDKLDEQGRVSRRYFIVSSAIGVISLSNLPQDVRVSGHLVHATRGAGDVNIVPPAERTSPPTHREQLWV